MIRRLILAIGVLLGAAGSAAASGGVITPPEALALQQAGKLTIIDVRTPDEWRQTGIPQGALTIELGGYGGTEGFAAEVARRVGDKAAPLAVICRSGHRSTQAWLALRAAGFTQVQNIKEGFGGGPNGPGWLARGLPVQQP